MNYILIPLERGMHSISINVENNECLEHTLTEAAETDKEIVWRDGHKYFVDYDLKEGDIK